MAKISKDKSNIFDIPHGAVITKKDYVYVNTSTKTLQKKNSKEKYSTHDKRCVGRAIRENKKTRPNKMFANAAYFQLFNISKLPPPPDRSDSLSIGLYTVVKVLSEKYGLIKILEESFGQDDAKQIIDLATYMVDEESAVFQHYPKWARKHCINTAEIISDSKISNFLKENLSYSKIEMFKNKWAEKNIGTGNVYLCYDSTNVNSRARGVFLIEKGYAKDDKTLEQVNTEYVVRQEDGFPLTYKEYPGSITDISQATEMIRFIKDSIGKDCKKITLLCDRGYISERNIEEMDEAGIGFLLMLRDNLTESKELINKYAKEVKSKSINYIDTYEMFGVTVQSELFRKGKLRYIHVLYNPELEIKERKSLMNQIKEREKCLKIAIERKTRYTQGELDIRYKWFKLETKESEQVKYKGRGRGVEKRVVSKEILGYERNNDLIDKMIGECGLYIIVTSEKMSAEQACYEYTKRDCVEKVFRTLKSSLGMDVIGVHSDDSIIGKSLIWFVASIIRAAIFKNLEKLREKDNKSYTVPASIDLLDGIMVDKNLLTNKYERRYQFTSKQKKIISAFGIQDSLISAVIKSL